MFKYIRNLLKNITLKQHENDKHTETEKPMIGKGRFDWFGATILSEGVVFTVYVKDAEKVELALFDKGCIEPKEIIVFPEECKLGDVYSMLIYGLKADTLEYMFIKNGSEYFLDPYAKEVSCHNHAEKENKERIRQYRGSVPLDNFDWQGVQNPQIPMSDLIIYELHVGGYTEEGTFGGLLKKSLILRSLVSMLSSFCRFSHLTLNLIFENMTVRHLVIFGDIILLTFFLQTGSTTAKVQMN